MGQKFVSVVVLLALSIVAAANAQVPAPDPSAAHVPEGFRVEVVLKEPGLYPAVNHAFGHAAHGAIALLDAK